MKAQPPKSSNAGELGDSGAKPRTVRTAQRLQGGRNLAVVAGNAISLRLKDAGLDPAQFTRDPSSARRAHRTRKPLRHRIVSLSFLLAVVIPSIVTALYMFLFAADQYHSRAAFAVRSVESTGATDLLGLVVQGGGATNVSDSYIINDYLQSQAVVEDVAREIDIVSAFNHRDADWFFRMGDDLSIEEKVDYWNDMVDVDFDSTSGLIFVNARAFTAKDAQAITGKIVENSDILVNRLSEDSHRESLRLARQEVARAEARLKVFRKELLAYREATQEISPLENAKITIELIGTLEQELTKNQAELKTLSQYLDPSSPQVRILQRQIESLKEQIAAERQRLGDGRTNEGSDSSAGRTISNRIASYEELELEREFAERLYTAALSSLEKARAEADAKQTYLAVFQKPTLSQEAQYPERGMTSLLVFLGLLAAWGICVMVYYNIRDRS
ncbi:RkpR, polysaccharide export protein [Rhizobiales bacterium]|uniref:RkpR, polysaccharide export protein n=1 Tax=Hongsoonwoonella zoysiae TaxID=2821844 RepID=UPI001560D7CE|nr:RkpR, polysaccharide export protein [Hongsoonwoonella zoysiae]NRG18543.1 RkpR, polysaccharide export protein [Hongsoonwoonella zoysiae]